MLGIAGIGLGVSGSVIYGLHVVQSFLTTDGFVSKPWALILHQNINIFWALLTGLWAWIMLDLLKDFTQLLNTEERISIYKTKSIPTDSNSYKVSYGSINSNSTKLPSSVENHCVV